MKRVFIKILSLMLVVTMAAGVLCSCGKKYAVIYIEDDNGEIAAGFNENMVAFHMAWEKTSNIVGMGMTEDNPQIWETTIGDFAKSLGQEAAEGYSDVTLGEFYTESAVTSAKTLVAAAYLFDMMKDDETPEGKLLAAADRKLEAQVDNTVSELQLSIGSKEDFESFISGAGISMEDFRKYYEISQKAIELKSAVYVSEEEKKDYFAKNYVVVKHFIINNVYKVNEAGDANVALTAEELAEKNAEIENVRARLNSGEEYEAIFEEYKHTDPGNAIYTEGYFVTRNSGLVPEFEDAAFSMEEGEVRFVKTQYGTHVMKKYALDPEKYLLYSDTKQNIDQQTANAAYSKLVKPYAEKVKVNSEIVANYSMNVVSMLKP